MNFAKVYSAEPLLLDAAIVAIETDISRGLHAFAVVGLPDKAVEESRDRVAAAIKNSGYTSPKSKNQKVTISLAPADLKKEGPIFDLGIALSYLLATGDLSFESEGKLFLGELSLDGKLRAVRGVLPCVKTARECGFSEVFVPRENASEAALIDGVAVYAADTLSELIEHLEGKTTLTAVLRTKLKAVNPDYAVNFDDIKGQETAKRGLIIAAAGGHNIILFGPPGTGKTLLARAFATILPMLSFEEVLEATAIHSTTGVLRNQSLITAPPFRSPHHTSSYVSLVGGGTTPRPGEVTLAHRGVLFLDEFPEFDRRVIDALRQPLEEHTVSIARAKGSAQFPANFVLIAAMNPCPCGNYGSKKECVCLPSALSRYRRKLSGPIVDRIDMWIEVPHIPHEQLAERRSGENRETKEACALVASARARQQERFSNTPSPTLRTNSDIGVRDIEALAQLTEDAEILLQESAKKLDLSPRSYHRVIKLARTIADLSEEHYYIEPHHILEALQYRPKELSY